MKLMTTLAALTMVALCSPTAAQDSFDVFAAHQSESTQKFDYGALDVFVERVSKDSAGRKRFYYGAMRQDGVAFLDRAADVLSRFDSSKVTKDEQLAYWLNLRNVLVLRAIANDSPGRSLKKARGDASAPGEMWTRKRVTVRGVPVSIDDIERRIILRNFDNPNLVYGLYQGVRGGPAFPAKSFTGDTVTASLETAGRVYVNAPGAVRASAKETAISPIFLWYQDDLFGGDEAGVRAHILSLADTDLKVALSSAGKIIPAKLDYGLDEIIIRQQVEAAPFDDRNRPSVPTGS